MRYYSDRSFEQIKKHLIDGSPNNFLTQTAISMTGREFSHSLTQISICHHDLKAGGTAFSTFPNETGSLFEASAARVKLLSADFTNRRWHYLYSRKIFLVISPYVCLYFCVLWGSILIFRREASVSKCFIFKGSELKDTM